MGTRRKINKGNAPRHFIREWRKFRGLTQSQLADRLDVAVSSISQLERGEQGYSQSMLEALAYAMRTDAASLIMRNPMADEIWSIEDQLRKAPEAKRREIIAVVETMLKNTG